MNYLVRKFYFRLSLLCYMHIASCQRKKERNTQIDIEFQNNNWINFHNFSLPNEIPVNDC